MSNPWTLDYWKSGEYQVAREKLDADQSSYFTINPPRTRMFDALALCPEAKVRVAIIGQDPYPDSRFATGLAFSIPEEYGPEDFPPTLRCIFDEYQSDLGYSRPNNGNLSKWAENGVLLWNAIPSCRAGSSLSHDWAGREWDYLTREIVRRLSARACVFAFLGSVARRFVQDVDTSSGAVVIETSHPSPRGSLNSRNPFRGSRLFSTINDKLVSVGMEPIDWRLDGVETSDSPPQEGEQRSGVVRPNLGKPLPLPNKPRPKYASSTFEV